MYTIIYEYGARLDKECLAETEAQFTKARALYNKCIEIITNARNCADQYLKERDPEVAAKMAVIDNLNNQFQAAKALNAEPRMKEIAGLRREAWRELHPLIKEARKEHREKLAEIFSVIGMRRECETYKARCVAVANGLGSATADDTHAAALKAWDWVRQNGGALQFRNALLRQQDHIVNRFVVGGGHQMDYVLRPKQIIGSMNRDVAKIKESRIFINPERKPVTIYLPDNIKKKSFGEFRFRLGNEKAGMWATGSWEYNRPFPDGARVTTIRLIRRKMGPFYKWGLQFQLSIPEIPIMERISDIPLCAIHLGFNLADSGQTRIGAISDNGDPSLSTLIDLPEDITEDLARVERIQKRRDENRDNIHVLFKSFSPNLPDDMAEEWTAIKKLPAQQVSIDRIKWLSRKMEQAGTPGEVPATLKEFTINDHNLYVAERGLHKRTLNRRKNFYRHLARDLAKQYRVIVVGRYDLKKMALRIDEGGERNELGQIARRSRFIAALYQLLECIQWACARTGSVMIEEEDLNYAHKCSGCDKERERESDLFQCECGVDVDIKQNAASTLYAQWKDKAATEAERVRAETELKHAQYIEKKAEKLKRMQDKRKVSSWVGEGSEVGLLSE